MKVRRSCSIPYAKERYYHQSVLSLVMKFYFKLRMISNHPNTCLRYCREAKEQ